MRNVARGEMTTRNEVVLIVWGVGVTMKHSNHMKIIIFKPQKRKELSLPSGNKGYVTFDFVHTGLSYRYMFGTVATLSQQEEVEQLGS